MTFQKFGKGLAALAATAFFGLALAQPAKATTYKVQDLGALGGPASIAVSISPNNQITGYAMVNGQSAAFLSSNGSTVKLGLVPGTAFSQGLAVNASGVVVGTSGGVAAKFASGRATSIGTLGGAGSSATGINTNGDIVGDSEDSADRNRAFIAPAGQALRDLGSLGGLFAYAAGINATGDVTGYSYLENNTELHAFYYHDGAMHDVGTLGGLGSYGYAINNYGRVVGCSYLSDNQTIHAITRYPGKALQDLGTLGGTGYSYAYGVNDHYQIVGQSNGRGVIWNSGKIFDLNTLIMPGSGWTITSAYGINDYGYIAANAKNGPLQHAVLLVPQP